MYKHCKYKSARESFYIRNYKIIIVASVSGNIGLPVTSRTGVLGNKTPVFIDAKCHRLQQNFTLISSLMAEPRRAICTSLMASTVGFKFDGIWAPSTLRSCGQNIRSRLHYERRPITWLNHLNGFLKSSIVNTAFNHQGTWASFVDASSTEEYFLSTAIS